MRSHYRPFICLTTQYSIVLREIRNVFSGCQDLYHIVILLYILVLGAAGQQHIVITVHNIKPPYVWMCLHFSFCRLWVWVMSWHYPMGEEVRSDAGFWTGALKPGRVVSGQTPLPQHTQWWDQTIYLCTAFVCILFVNWIQLNLFFQETTLKWTLCFLWFSYTVYPK